MTIVDIKVGHLVFVIENNSILEGKITRFIDEKEVIVCLTDITYYPPTVKKTYGVDYFFTRDKANKVLETILELKRKRELEHQKQIEKERVRKLEREKQREKEFKEREIQRGYEIQEAKKRICEACGLPIGNFGHCGCSH